MSWILKRLMVASLMLAAGCASGLQVIEGGVAPISLEKAQVVRIDGQESITFPAGIYAPDFRTEEGTYYRAPVKLLHSAPRRGSNTPRPGGLFLPFPVRPDQRQGVWFDDRENSVFGSPEKLWRLEENVQFKSGPLGR